MWKEILHATKIATMAVDAQIDAPTAWGHMQQTTPPALSGRQ
jgi:hypothetical protein